MEEIHVRLKEFIIKTKLKNVKISEETGFSLQKVSDLKNGKQNITPEIALLFEEKFALNPCWLFFGRGVMTPTFDLDENEKEPMSYDELYSMVKNLSKRVSKMEDLNLSKLK